MLYHCATTVQLVFVFKHSDIIRKCKSSRKRRRQVEWKQVLGDSEPQWEQSCLVFFIKDSNAISKHSHNSRAYLLFLPSIPSFFTFWWKCVSQGRVVRCWHSLSLSHAVVSHCSLSHGRMKDSVCWCVWVFFVWWYVLMCVCVRMGVWVKACVLMCMGEHVRVCVCVSADVGALEMSRILFQPTTTKNLTRSNCFSNTDTLQVGKIKLGFFNSTLLISIARKKVQLSELTLESILWFDFGQTENLISPILLFLSSFQSPSNGLSGVMKCWKSRGLGNKQPLRFILFHRIFFLL